MCYIEIKQLWGRGQELGVLDVWGGLGFDYRGCYDPVFEMLVFEMLVFEINI